MNLLMIHGRDQQGKDPVILKKLWQDTLVKGLDKSGLSLPESTKIIFPFYGDMLDELVRQGDVAPLAEVVTRGATGGNPDEALLNDLVTELAENAAIPTEMLNDIEGNEIHEKGPLNWRWVQAILQKLDDHTGVGGWSVKKFTYDVYVYLTIKGIANRINKFVIDEMGNEPCVVVAHSLGSIVAYNILRNMTAPNVARFITVGSPLGLRSIQQRLQSPLMMPPTVQNGWYNAYDDRDVVALNPLDAHYFNIDPAITNNGHIRNFTDNRHGIEGYLDDAEIAKEIHRYL